MPSRSARTLVLYSIAAAAILALLACSPQRGTVQAAARRPDHPGAGYPLASVRPGAPAQPYDAAPLPPSQPDLTQTARQYPPPIPAPDTSRPSAFAAPPIPPLVIPSGTRLRVRLSETLNTRDTHPGERFQATLDEPIVVGDRVAVPRGTYFTGTILQSKSSGRFRGRAQLELTLLSFQMNGQTYRVETRPDTRVSGSHKKRNWWLMGGGSAGGAGIGALAGGGTGALIGAGAGAAAGTTTAFFTGKKNVKLPVETPLVFSLRSSIAVQRA
jgi:hypothetical protein